MTQRLTSPRQSGRQSSRIMILLFILLTACFTAEGARRERWQERDEWQNVPGIFSAMGACRNAVVADVGSRDGYLTLRLADVVGDTGRVYAVDIDEEALDRLRDTLEDEGIKNVVTVHSESDNPKLPRGTFDAVVIVNAYHEMDEYEPMLEHVRRALKPGGRLVVVDAIDANHRGESRSSQTASHEIGLEYVKKDLVDAGFEIVQARDPFVDERDDGDQMWLLAAVPR